VSSIYSAARSARPGGKVRVSRPGTLPCCAGASWRKAYAAKVLLAWVLSLYGRRHDRGDSRAASANAPPARRSNRPVYSHQRSAASTASACASSAIDGSCTGLALSVRSKAASQPVLGVDASGIVGRPDSHLGGAHQGASARYHLLAQPIGTASAARPAGSLFRRRAHGQAAAKSPITGAAEFFPIASSIAKRYQKSEIDRNAPYSQGSWRDPPACRLPHASICSR